MESDGQLRVGPGVRRPVRPGVRRAGLPPHEVSPLQGKLLHLLTKAVGARKVLEIGTLGGYSTIWLARALPPDGKIITLEHNPDHAEVAQMNLTRAGVSELVEVRVGLATDTLPRLVAEGRCPFRLRVPSAVAHPWTTQWVTANGGRPAGWLSVAPEFTAFGMPPPLACNLLFRTILLPPRYPRPTTSTLRFGKHVTAGSVKLRSTCSSAALT